VAVVELWGVACAVQLRWTSNRSDYKITTSFPKLLASVVFLFAKVMLRAQCNSRIQRRFWGSEQARS